MQLYYFNQIKIEPGEEFIPIDMMSYRGAKTFDYDDPNEGLAIGTYGYHKERFFRHFQLRSYVVDFIEDYHEKLEETYIFPVYIKQNKHVKLIKELVKQHKLGRNLTNKIMLITNEGKLKVLMKKFIYMYRAHETREDTVVFSEFRKYITEKEFDEITDRFEETENKQFGKNGFEHILKIVEKMEKEIGIYKLSHYSVK